jgi:hypothetical protein
MKPSTIVLTILGIFWILAITAWSFTTASYQFSAGSAASPPGRWPLSSRIPLTKDRATLIMLAHPQCPCTHASVAELSRLMSGSRDKVKAYVLFFTPHSLPSHWQEHSALREETEKIPGVTVLDDIDMVEAKRFQAKTSGQTLVYSEKGDLLFSGGITVARGQIGDSIGSRSLTSILESNPTKARTTLVFGCPLTTPFAK